MSELMTVTGNGLVKTSDPVAPIIVPTGEPPSAAALSAGNAAAAASGASSVGKSFLGLDLEGAEAGKNFVFLAVIGFFIYKYGRRFFQ